MVLQSSKMSNVGRKRTVDISQFLKAFYLVVRDGVRTSRIQELFAISKTTYFRYLRILENSNMFTKMNDIILNSYTLQNVLMCDTFTVKSHNGSERTGANPTDRARRGVKVQVIADVRGVIDSYVVCPANIHDSRIFTENLTKTYSERKDLLMDSAYVGEPVRNKAQQHNLRAVTVPKKKCNGQMSHALSPSDNSSILQRWRIERLFAVLRQNRGISNKYTKRIGSYCLYLACAIFVTNYHHIVMERFAFCLFKQNHPFKRTSSLSVNMIFV